MLARPDPPSWRALQRIWPHASTSRFVEVGGMRWHVQMMGEGPVALLVHGTGASSHSWRDVMPLLAERMQVVTFDLPGHAFTETPPVYRLTLPRVAKLIGELVAEMGLSVDLAVGHSAGAAILTQMVLDKSIKPKAFVSINGAFKPFDGMAGAVFPAIAKLLFVNPLTPRLFAMSGRDQRRVERLIEGTGSDIGQEGLDYYHALMMSSGHIAGVLAMMANWDLERLQPRFAEVDVPTLLLTGSNDKAVPPHVSERVANMMSNAQLHDEPSLGHLLHEENPDLAASHCLAFAEQKGVFA